MDRSTQQLLHGAGLPYAQALVDAAQRYNVPIDLAMKIANQENGFRHIDPRTGQVSISSAGAIGYMQLMPKTAQELRVNPFDVWQNIDGGVKYLGQMLQRYRDPSLAAAAYNAGPNRVDKYLSRGVPLPDETTNYVRSVSAMRLPDAPAPSARPVQTVPVQGAPMAAQSFGDTVQQPPGLLTIPGM